MSLVDAKAALERDDPSSAIVALLAAWRAVKDPRIANILDAVSARVSRPALDAKSQKALVEEFVALAKAGDPLDQGRLCATIGTTRSGQMVECLEALIECWPADPRFTRPLLELLKRPPYIGSGTQSAWRRLFKLLQTFGDARVIELLPAIAFKDLLPQTGQPNTFAVNFFTERATACVDAMKKAMKKGVPASKEDAILVALDALAKPDAATNLVAEVLANPAELGARDVLADQLIESSDVRGRFIMLQRSRTADTIAEEKALLAAHGVQWLGELAALVEHDTMTFEDGFLATCVIETDQIGRVKQLTGHPSWSTVRHIHLAGRAFPHDFLTHPVMRSLATVTGMYDFIAGEIFAKRTTYPWTGVGLDPSVEYWPTITANLKHAFPNLRELHLRAYDRTADDFAFLWRDFPDLSTVGFYAPRPPDFQALLEAAVANTRPSTVIDIHEYHHLGYQLRLSNERRDLDLRARTSWGRKLLKFSDLARFASSLAGTLQTIRVHDRSTKAERAALDKLLAPGGKLDY